MTKRTKPRPSKRPPSPPLSTSSSTAETSRLTARQPASLSKAISKLAAIPTQLRLIIAGNHEITLDEPYYLSLGGTTTTHAAATKAIQQDAAAQGVTHLAEGTHAFTLANGATFTVYASPYTPQFGASAFQYPTAEDRFNPATTTPA